MQLTAGKDEVVGGELSESEVLTKKEEQQEGTTQPLLETDPTIVTNNGLDQPLSEKCSAEEELSSSEVVATVIDFMVDGQVATRTNPDSVNEPLSAQIDSESSGLSTISSLPEGENSDDKKRGLNLSGEKEVATSEQKEVNGEVAHQFKSSSSFECELA